MEQFPHLKFKQKIDGKPKYPPTPVKEHPITLANKKNRQTHSGKLQRWITSIKSDWEATINQRNQDNLAEIDPEIQPIFLKINPNILYSDFNLTSFGIEIISEEDDGFIIGASIDNFRTLEEKVAGFISLSRGSGKIADLWEIIEGKREAWRPEHILSEELFVKWHTIEDNTIYCLEISIAFDKPLRKEPDVSKIGGPKRFEKYLKEVEERDELLLQRQTHFEEFIQHYGIITSGFVELSDSFGCEAEITGQGLKDLVLNYQFVFEVAEVENVTGIDNGEDFAFDSSIELIAPDKNAIEVGVIDSGIMEGNKYLSPAIKPNNSRSYLKSETSTADYVARGGHGTKVAGAILYPNGISSELSPYQLPCYVRNLRVLNADNKLTHLLPAELTKQIVEENPDCTIFNLSISTNSSFRKKHMSMWAATIDNLTFEKDVLFVIASGNITFDVIAHYLKDGNPYPNYLQEPFCRIANPAQSSFGITVGSINSKTFDNGSWKSLGNADEISAFSRIGTGIWGQVKPDVVEYGGGIVYSDGSVIRVKEHPETATELIRSTLHGGNAFGKDSVGTSFAAPKVTHIAARLKQIYPDEGVNVIRALIAQGARLPKSYFEKPTLESIQHFGYGLPSLDRVTKNSEHRITFYNTGTISAEEAHIYAISIPKEIREQGDEYDILIEVSLAFTGKTRRTRQKTKSYLSTWLDWSSSKLDENYDSFYRRSITDSANDTENESDPGNCIKWKIRERNNWGDIKDLNRNNSTLQKDWAIMKSYELTEEICFAVRGHKGWDKNHTKTPYAFVVSIEILGTDIPIYQLIKIENEIKSEININV